MRKVLAHYECEIRDFDVKTKDGEDRARLEFHVKLLTNDVKSDILEELLRMEGTIRAHWA